MDTNRLKQFYVISQVENLREAASLLGITHSGLSKSMKVLQSDLGYELFEQKGRGIQITERGKELSLKLPSFFREMEDLLTSKKKESSGLLRVGSFEVFTTHFLALLAPEFNQREVELHEVLPGELEQRLIDGQIDIGITYEPIPRSGIEYLKITSIEAGIFYTNKNFSKMNFEDIPFAVPRIPLDSVPTGVKGLDGWPDDKVTRNAKYKVDMLESAIQLVLSGHCAVFLPKFIAKIKNHHLSKSNQLLFMDNPKKMKTVKHSVYLVKRSNQKEDSDFKKIAKVLRGL